MDCDGLQDIIISARLDTIFIYRNISSQGSINFLPVIKIPCLEFNNSGFDIKDMDNDGKPDIIFGPGEQIGTTNYSYGNAYVVKNNYTTGTLSSSSFSSRIYIGSTPTIYAPYTFSIFARDLNADNKPEIIMYQNHWSTLNVTTNDSIFIFQNNVSAPGTIDSSMFSVPVIFRSYNNFGSSAYHDVNMDGYPELIINHGIQTPFKINIFKNLISYPGASISTSSFASKVVYDYSSYSSSCYWGAFGRGIPLNVLDITGDGKSEIVLPGAALSFINNGSGGVIDTSTFSQRICGISSSINSYDMLLCDLDSDGRADVIRFGYSSPTYNLCVSKGNRNNRPPTTQPSSFYFSGFTSNSLTTTFNSGDGMGRIILARAGTSIPAGDTPVSNLNGIYNTANNVFGSGTQIGSTGTYVVYMGTGTSATVTGLSPSTNYVFKIFEYNGNATGLAYLTTGATSITVPTLPVKLINFTAEKQNEDVLLHWQTASELNNDRFEIERSNKPEASSQWLKAGTVKGHGTTNSLSNYQFVDDVSTPLDRTNLSTNQPINFFYRLKQIDFDGKFEYSKIVSVSFDKINKNEIVVSPNPANNELHVSSDSYRTSSTSNMNLQLYDITGKLVVEENFIQHLTFNIQHCLPGIYFLKITDEQNSSVKMQKVVVMK